MKLMKRILGLGLLCALFITLASGCVFVLPFPRNLPDLGDLETFEYTVDDFTALSINAPVEVHYSTSDSCAVTLKLHENLEDRVTVDVRGGTLYVEASNLVALNNIKPLQLYVSSPTLEKLVFSGVVNMQDCDTISGDSLRIDIEGVCNLKLDLDVEVLDMNITSVGSLNLSGTADEASLTLEGAASVKAYDLTVGDATVYIEGVGNVELDCTDSLDVTIDGVGNMSYSGNPHVTKHSSGLGAVSRRD